MQRAAASNPVGAGAAAPDTAGFWTGHPMMGAALRGVSPVQAKGGMELADGDVQSVAHQGVSGYNEYYAQPASDASDIFGKNRILRQTNDSDSGTYWWATSDHYTSVAHVTDA